MHHPTYHRSAPAALAFLLFLFSFAPLAGATQISGVTISDITATSAVVSWTTDVKADATINYGLDSSFGVVRDPTFTTTAHSLTIPGLSAGTPYYFRVESADSAGNTSATAGFQFTTTGAQTALQKAVTAIQQLSTPQDLLSAQQALQQQASGALSPPTVLGAAKVTPDVTSAEITWSTDRAAGSEVDAEPDSTYDPNASDPYSITQGNASESVTSHDVTLIGLQPDTVYHFRVVSKDQLGLIGQTQDDTFTTKAQVPTIQHIVLSNISETVATVSWSTNGVLANGSVNFTDQRTHRTLSMGDPAYLTQHSVELTGLVYGTPYQVVIVSSNQTGDTASSSPINFTTARNTVPPNITNVTNQSTLFPSDNVEIQTIITWHTDEAAYCQLFYIHGVAKNSANPPTSEPLEQNPLTDHTVVIVGLTPSSVYTFWVQCQDSEYNQSKSDDYVLITPDKQKNIIDLILQNFQGTFGWINNIGK